MPKSPLDIRVLTKTSDLDDYDILSTQTLSVAVPYKTTESLRKLIWAAMMTYSFGNQSVDHVLRRYGHHWDHRANKSFEVDPCLLLLRKNNEEIAFISSKLEAQEIDDRLGPVCAKSALCRLEATFKAAYGLIRKNYIFEASAIARMILEQLAWAHEAHRATDSDLPALSPTRCVTPFKVVFPEAGRFYGELSEDLDPAIVEHYLRFHEEGQPVVKRSMPDSQHVGYYLTALAYVYLKVVQNLFSTRSESDYAAQLGQLRDRHHEYCSLLNVRTVEGEIG